jgi:hypothetical protein
MRAVVDPAATELDELASRDGRRMPNDGDQVPLTTCLTRRTQKPFSALWNVTRSTNPASASVSLVRADTSATFVPLPDARPF